MTVDTLTFDSPVQFQVEAESRTIRGLALPFGDVGVSRGRKFRFSAKSRLTWSKPKLLMGHDWGKTIGTSVFQITPDGVELTRGKVAATALGDEALALCADPDNRVFDGLSVGLGEHLETVLAADGVHDVIAAELIECSITPLAAFARAAITSVAASAVPTEKESTMDEETPKVEAPAFDMTAITAAVTAAVDAQLATFTAVPPREANPTAKTKVKEELPYRFDGAQGGQFSLLTDAKDAQFGNDAAAAQRMETFLGEAFAAIAMVDVTDLNPAQNRPELYVSPLRFNRPLWSLVTTGSITDSTPFLLPKFNTKTGKGIQAHVQGTEPTEMSLTTTKQTVTPTALSGLAKINREVYDQGGNPSLDKIIWDEMINDYYENLEVDLAALLATGTGVEINVGAGANDPAKVQMLKAALVALQFAKGGDRYRCFAGDPTLYSGLACAIDTTGRPLLPVVNAMNADGGVRPGYEAIQIGTKQVVPAWALDKTVANAETSYLFVPESVFGWVSGPRRLDLQLSVKEVQIGIWGYKASACVRLTDIVPVDWTTADV